MNRRDRRNAEKKTGLYKQFKNSSLKKRFELLKRKQQVGKKIHRQHLENIENQSRKNEGERQQSILIGLLEAGHSYERAQEIIANNIKVDNDREKKNEKP